LGLVFQLVLATVSSLIIWLLVFGVTGLFFRYLDRPVGWIGYLAGASYWIYLAHFPLMIWLPIALASVDLPAEVKLVIVLTVALSLLLIMYEFVVRGTVIDGCRPEGKAIRVDFNDVITAPPKAEIEPTALVFEPYSEPCETLEPGVALADA